MQENNNKQHSEGCMCGVCNGNMGGYGPYGYHGRHVFLRWILGIIIIIGIFSFGMKIGELKGQFEEGEYGQTRMMRYYEPMPMMYQGYAPATTATPITPATTR